MRKVSKAAALRNAVHEQVDNLMASEAFAEWTEATTLKPGDLVAFNNSFLFRDGITFTAKNAKYLCVEVNKEGALTTPPRIIEPGGINLRFKRFPASQTRSLDTAPLPESIEFELKNLGTIVRALIGRIGPDEPAVVDIDKVPNWYTMSYDPSQSDVVRIQSGTISISRIDDINVVWSAIERAISAADLHDETKLASVFESKFRELREMAYRPVDIDKVDPAEPSILAEVVERIDSQINDYKRALRSHLARRANPESFNELLRIAYNFADGTQELLRLIIGISDMKPLISWLTIHAQSKLVDRFQHLPLGIIGSSKPSIGKYRAVVAGARNQAFHDIFAFEQPFRVRLTGDAFRTPELRLFRQYSSKTPALDYEDRKLVTLLEGFTRTAEQTVPLGFWESNLEVMQAVADLARSLWSALLIVVR
jgi:hypothetical protein